MKPEDVITSYIARIDRDWRTGKATEHTYRGARDSED